MPGVSCPGVKKVVTGRTPFERLHGKKPTQEFVPFGEKVLARQITTDPMNGMKPRYQYGVWMGRRNNSAECFIGNADGVFRAREIRRLEPQSRWDTEVLKNVIGVVPQRMQTANGRWTDQKFEWTRSQSRHCHFQEHESRGKESPRKTSTSSDPRLDVQAAMRSGTTKERNFTQIVAESESKSVSEPLHTQRDLIEGIR